MSVLRGVKTIFKYTPTHEGSGMKLKRAFGFYQIPKFDPFLQLDEFHSDGSPEFAGGIPLHPHRGIETITYILGGKLKYSDNSGRNGKIGEGDIHWVSAGSGIIHEEIPESVSEEMRGFQLWVNMPARKKMTKPFQKKITADKVPEVMLENGTAIKIISGSVYDKTGPLENRDIDAEILDIKIPANTVFQHKIPPGKNAFCYVYCGAMDVYTDTDETIIASGHTALFSNGNTVKMESGGKEAGLLMVSGRPLRENIAWSGPIVMNSDTELRHAFREYEEGKFLQFR